MTWNYRVVHRKIEEDSFAVHEAFYNKGKKKPYAITQEPSYPQGQTSDELKKDVELYLQALKLPVLEYDEIGNNK